MISLKTHDMNERRNDYMANCTAEQWNAIKIEIMEKCYNSFAELGLHGTGM